jgi:hypothetical protein
MKKTEIHSRNEGIIKTLESENKRLAEENSRLRAKVEQLKAELEMFKKNQKSNVLLMNQNAFLEGDIEKWKAENESNVWLCRHRLEKINRWRELAGEMAKAWTKCDHEDSCDCRRNTLSAYDKAVGELK